MYGLSKLSPPDADDAATRCQPSTSGLQQQQQPQQQSPLSAVPDVPPLPDVSDEELSSDDSVVDIDLQYTMVSARYNLMRNVNKSRDEQSVQQLATKTTINFVNLNFIESNFKSMGLNNHVDENFIMEAKLEFESLEKWYIDNSTFGTSSKNIMNNLRLPLFCHLYINLYKDDYRQCMHALLESFNYLFKSSRGVDLFNELKDYKGPDEDLSTFLSSLRNGGKFVFLVSEEFMFHLNGFLQNHILIKTIFDEWFNVIFVDEEDPFTIYDGYKNKTVSQINNVLVANTPKQNNNGFGDDLIEKKPNSSENQNIDPSATTTDPEKNEPNSSQNKNISPSVSDTSFYDIQRPSTSKEHMNMSYEEPHSSKDQSNDDKVGAAIRSSRMKKSSEDSEEPIDPPVEPHSEVSEDEEMQEEQSQDSSSDEEQSSISSENTSSTSSDDTYEDSFSEPIDYDDEYGLRKYVKRKLKSSRGPTYDPSLGKDIEYVTKFDARNLEEDPYLCTTRQITLTNCCKVTCSMLTSDHAYVAAGSIDSLVYVWERSDVATQLQQSYDVIDKIGKRVEKNLSYVDPEEVKNFNEVLDRSNAFVLRGHGGVIYSLGEISASKLLLSSSNDGTFRAWSLETKHCLEVFDMKSHGVWCVNSCPSTLQVATGSRDGICCLWYLEYEAPVRMLTGHSDDVLILKFHYNRSIIATGSSDKTIRLYELTTGEALRMFVGHSGYICCLEFHVEKPDILASACNNGDIILWDIYLSVQIWKLKVANVSVTNLSWLSTDILLASSITGTVLKCDITKDYINSTRRIEGFSTSFDRLLFTSVFDHIVYTIGVPDKATAQKSSMKLKTKPSTRSRNEQTPSTFFPKHIIENSGSLMRELHSALLKNARENSQHQVKADSKKVAKEKSKCLNKNVESSTLNVTSADVPKLNEDNQSNNIRIDKNPLKKPVSTVKNPVVATSGQFPQNIQSTNVPLSDNVQIDIGSTMANVQEQIKPQDRQETNVTTNLLVQQPQPKLSQHHAKSTNMNVQQQQDIPTKQPVTRPRHTAHFLQRSVLPQSQPLQPDFSSIVLDPDFSSIVLEPDSNFLQQTLCQQIQPSNHLTKVQQQKPQQLTNIQPSNEYAPKTFRIPRSETQVSGLYAQQVASSSSTQSQPIRISSSTFSSSSPIQISTTPDQRDQPVKRIKQKNSKPETQVSGLYAQQVAPLSSTQSQPIRKSSSTFSSSSPIQISTTPDQRDQPVKRIKQKNSKPETQVSGLYAKQVAPLTSTQSQPIRISSSTFSSSSPIQTATTPDQRDQPVKRNKQKNSKPETQVSGLYAQQVAPLSSTQSQPIRISSSTFSYSSPIQTSTTPDQRDQPVKRIKQKNSKPETQVSGLYAQQVASSSSTQTQPIGISSGTFSSSSPIQTSTTSDKRDQRVKRLKKKNSRPGP